MRSSVSRAHGREHTPFSGALHDQFYQPGFRPSNCGRWIISPRTGKRVGLLMREGGILIFQRLVSESRHKFDNRNAWGLEVDLLAHVEELGGRWLRIVASDSQRVLCAPLKLFHERGVSVNFRHGTQLVLSESLFVLAVGEVDDDPFADAPAIMPEVPAQGSLFAEVAE